jgi:hypothetical protein
MASTNGTRIPVADVLAVDASVAASTGGGDFGVTVNGFQPKAFARLLAEKLALARTLFGEDVDLTAGSAIRKLLEVSALEDARTWAALATMYDNSFVSTAAGDALSRLGEELGLARPYLEAQGTVTLQLTGAAAPGAPDPLVLELPRGARLLTPGGHDIATNETVQLSAADPQKDVSVVAFYPGPEQNLDPAQPDQKIGTWNELDDALEEYFALRDAAGSTLKIEIKHTQKLAGGELQWPDVRYRDLLLRAPRSIWTVDAIEVAVGLVPGVRRVQVRDAWGGLDINQSIFGDFNFIERLFSSERDLGTPYYLTVLVAPTPAAIWDGPGNLQEAVETAIQDLRPISIFPNVEQAEVVGVGLQADLVVDGVPLPTGTPQTVNQSQAAAELKARLVDRVRKYIDALSFGEPVRAAEVTWALMSEPGIADVRNLRLLRYPANFDAVSLVGDSIPDTVQTLGYGDNVELGAGEIAETVEETEGLWIT